MSIRSSLQEAMGPGFLDPERMLYLAAGLSHVRAQGRDVVSEPERLAAFNKLPPE